VLRWGLMCQWGEYWWKERRGGRIQVVYRMLSNWNTKAHFNRWLAEKLSELRSRAIDQGGFFVTHSRIPLFFGCIMYQCESTLSDLYTVKEGISIGRRRACSVS